MAIAIGSENFNFPLHNILLPYEIYIRNGIKATQSTIDMRGEICTRRDPISNIFSLTALAEEDFGIYDFA